MLQIGTESIGGEGRGGGEGTEGGVSNQPYHFVAASPFQPAVLREFAEGTGGEGAGGMVKTPTGQLTGASSGASSWTLGESESRCSQSESGDERMDGWTDGRMDAACVNKVRLCASRRALTGSGQMSHALIKVY